MPSTRKSNRIELIIMTDIINKTCQLLHWKDPWNPIGKSSETDRCAKNNLVSSRTCHVTFAQCSGVNLDLFYLTASVSIIPHSLNTWIYNGHRSPNNFQSSAAKVQSVSLGAYILPGRFLAPDLCIDSSFVLLGIIFLPDPPLLLLLLLDLPMVGP